MRARARAKDFNHEIHETHEIRARANHRWTRMDTDRDRIRRFFAFANS